MPFAAAIPLISAGVGALGSIFGGKAKAPVNPNQAQINALETSLNAPGAAPDNAATDSAQNFYKTILSGSQANTRALLGPDVNTIMGQYDNAAKAAAQLGPRRRPRCSLATWRRCRPGSFAWLPPFWLGGRSRKSISGR